MGTEKQVPKGVPEENEYHSLHWAVLLTYAIACGAIYSCCSLNNLFIQFC